MLTVRWEWERETRGERDGPAVAGDARDLVEGPAAAREGRRECVRELAEDGPETDEAGMERRETDLSAMPGRVSRSALADGCSLLAGRGGDDDSLAGGGCCGGASTDPPGARSGAPPPARRHTGAVLGVSPPASATAPPGRIIPFWQGLPPAALFPPATRRCHTQSVAGHDKSLCGPSQVHGSLCQRPRFPELT